MFDDIFSNFIKKLTLQESVEKSCRVLFFKLDKKNDDEQGLLYGTFSEANIEDLEGDIISNEEVEKMAHKAMINLSTGGLSIFGGKSGETHLKSAKNTYLVESYIDKSSENWKWKGTVQTFDTKIREEIKKGNILGFSVGGIAVKEEI